MEPELKDILADSRSRVAKREVGRSAVVKQRAAYRGRIDTSGCKSSCHPPVAQCLHFGYQYGNEADITTFYSAASLLVVVPPSSERGPFPIRRGHKRRPSDGELTISQT